MYLCIHVCMDGWIYKCMSVCMPVYAYVIISRCTLKTLKIKNIKFLMIFGDILRK